MTPNRTPQLFKIVSARSAVTILGIFLTQMAHAEPANPHSLYIPLENAIRQASSPDSISDSIVSLQFHGSYSDWNCSGAFISDTGEILTASHCLDECRFEEDTNKPLPQNATCEARIRVGDKYFGDSPDNYDNFRVEIVRAGPCTNAYLQMRDENKFKEHVPPECQGDKREDWAVIRLAHWQERFSTSRLKCLVVMPKVPVNGEALMTIGLPAGLGIGLPPNDSWMTSGNDFYGSFGKASEGNTCTTVELSESPIMPTIFTDQILASIATTGGSSGGPLLNARMEVIGVVSTGVLHKNGGECIDASRFQNLLGWPQFVSTSKISNCDVRRIQSSLNLNASLRH